MRIDSSSIRPREETTTPSATSWSPGSTRIKSPGTTSSARSSIGSPSRTALALGATRSASWSSVSLAFSSWRIPIAELITAMNPNRASANSPSASMRTKKAPRMALKRVKTLPATMLATERLLGGSGTPRPCSRLAASALVNPGGCGCSLIRDHLYRSRVARIAARQCRRTFQTLATGPWRPHPLPSGGRRSATRAPNSRPCGSSISRCRRRHLRLRRSIGMRQDDRDADGQPHGRDH